MSRLSDQEIHSALSGLPGWERAGDSLRRPFQFSNFAEAMRFVNQVAEAAEMANHHPDIDIRYNRVLMILTSHDAGGITSRDVKMAAKIGEIAAPSRRS